MAADAEADGYAIREPSLAVPEVSMEARMAARENIKSKWDKVRKAGRAAMAIARVMKSFRADAQAEQQKTQKLLRSITFIEPRARNPEQIDGVFDAIKGIQFFKNLMEKGMTVVQLKELCRNMRIVTLGRDEVIFEEDSVGDCFYVIMSGEVGIYVRGNKDPKGLPRVGVERSPSEEMLDEIASKASKEGAGDISGDSDGDGDDDAVEHVDEADLSFAPPKPRKRTTNSVVAGIPPGLRDQYLKRLNWGKQVTALVDGQTFGEFALMDGKTTRTATASSECDGTQLLVIHKEDYDKVLKNWHSERYADKMRRLSEIECLCDVSQGDMGDLAYVVMPRKYRVGDYIFREGEHVDHDAWVMFINRGQCSVTRHVRQVMGSGASSPSGGGRGGGGGRLHSGDGSPKRPSNRKQGLGAATTSYEICKLSAGHVAYALIPMTNGRLNTRKHQGSTFPYSLKAVTLVELLVLSKHDILYRIRSEAMASIKRNLAAFPSYVQIKKMCQMRQKWDDAKKDLILGFLSNTGKGRRVLDKYQGAGEVSVGFAPLSDARANANARQKAGEALRRRKTHRKINRVRSSLKPRPGIALTPKKPLAERIDTRKVVDAIAGVARPQRNGMGTTLSPDT